MTDFDKSSQEKMRKKHNDDLLKRFQQGDSLKSFDSNASWFPPRPIIEKDKKALEFLHKESHQGKNDKEKQHLSAIDSIDAEKKSEKSE